MFVKSLQDTIGKISHRARCCTQWVHPSKVGIIGNYHGGNLGEMCLGASVAGMLSAREKSISCGLQNDISVVHEYRDFLRSVFGITCRSNEQAQNLNLWLGRNDVSAHPDLTFALKERVPCLAFCYSSKSNRLLNDLGVEDGAFLDLDEVVNGVSKERLHQMIESPVILNPVFLEKTETTVRGSIDSLLNRWGV